MQRLQVRLVFDHSDKSVTTKHHDWAGYNDEKRVALDTWAAGVRAILKRGEGGKVVAFSRALDSVRDQMLLL